MTRFKVLTYNVFKLGGPVAPERVIERVLDLEPDFMGFQEVFNTRFSIPAASILMLRPHPGEKALGEALVEPVSSEVRLREKETVVRKGVTTEENLSDHYGLATEFELK